MLLKFYLEADIICIIPLCCLAYHTVHSNFSKTNRTNFLVVLWLNILFAFSDMIWVFNNGYLDYMSLPMDGRRFAYLINGINVCLSGATGWSWLHFSEDYQERYYISTRKGTIISLLPMAVLAAVTATTGQTHFLFYITESGEYVRRGGYALQVAISYGYIVTAVILSLSYARTATTWQQRRRHKTMASFAVFPTIACAAQLCMPGMPVLFIGTLIALLNVYIAMQGHQVLNDSLTGLNNRTLLDQKIMDEIAALDDRHDTWLLIMDANNFKGINDTYGHLEGDRALIMIADALRKACGNSNDFLCRYGGDEFVILHRTEKNQNCLPLMEKINAILAKQNLPYKLSVSIGAARCSEDVKEWQRLVKAADDDLYRVKAEFKKKLQEGAVEAK